MHQPYTNTNTRRTDCGSVCGLLGFHSPTKIPTR